MQINNWNDLRYLLALKRCGTLSATAKTLGVDDTTVSRRLSAMQDTSGNQLFHRNPNGRLQLTECGDAIISHAENIEHSVDLIEDILGSQTQSCSGVVRVTSVPMVINRLLTPDVDSLIKDYPNLEIELIPESRDLNLTHREADLAIRLARPSTGGTQIKIRKLGELRCSIYALRKYSPQKLSKLPWIAYDDTLAHIPPDRWIRKTAGITSEATSPLRVHDAETALQATLAGLGKTVLPDLVVAKDKRLQRLASNSATAVPSRPLWLMAHANQTRLNRIVAVTGWIDRIFDASA